MQQYTMAYGQNASSCDALTMCKHTVFEHGHRPTCSSHSNVCNFYSDGGSANFIQIQYSKSTEIAAYVSKWLFLDYLTITQNKKYLQ